MQRLTDHERVLLVQQAVEEHHSHPTGVHPALENRVRATEDFQRDIRTSLTLARWALGVALVGNIPWIVELIRSGFRP